MKEQDRSINDFERGVMKKRGRRFKELVESCPDIISVHNKGGIFIYVSPLCKELIGYDYLELVGHSVFDFLHKDDVLLMRKCYSRIMQNPNSYTVTYRMRGKDGTYVWFETVSRAVYDDKTKKIKEVVSVSRDITRRKEDEERSLTSEKQLRTMVDTTSVLMWVSDSIGNYIFFNTGWLRFTGRPPRKEKDRGWLRGVYPPDLNRIRNTYYKHARRLQPFEHEYRLKNADGEYRWILERAIPYFSERSVFEGYTGSCFDITPLKEVNQELKKSHREMKRLKFVIDSMSEHIIITDREGNILYANKAAEKSTGFSFEEMKDKKHGTKELWGGHMKKDFYEKLWQTIKKDKKTFVGKIKNRRKNGEWYWAQLRVQPLLGDNQGVKFYVAFEHEIDESEGDQSNVAQQSLL